MGLVPRVTKVTGFVHQQLAITPEWLPDGQSKNWVLTHLPTGHTFVWSCETMFLTADQGIKAMLEIAGIRKDWNAMDHAAYRPDLPKIKAIARKHGGFKPSDYISLSFERSKALNG